VAVALPAWHHDAEFYKAQAWPGLGVEPWQLDPDFLQTYARPKVFVVGERDPFAPPGAVKRLVDRIPEPKTLHIVPGADHFFRGQERTVANVVVKAIAVP
jgi:pimeloyl-ACP methyl ester carboxylesterase